MLYPASKPTRPRQRINPEIKIPDKTKILSPKRTNPAGLPGLPLRHNQQGTLPEIITVNRRRAILPPKTGRTTFQRIRREKRVFQEKHTSATDILRWGVEVSSTFFGDSSRVYLIQGYGFGSRDDREGS